MIELPHEQPPRDEPRRSISRAQWSLAGLIVALAAGGLLYRIFVVGRLEQTSALFIGLPAVVALVLSLTPPAGSATGTIMKGMTIALLLSGPILGEGFICILMAAPLFYLVGAIIGRVMDRSRKRGTSSTTARAVVLLPLLLASLEGTTPALTFPTRRTVQATATIHATPGQVQAALARTPSFHKELPAFLRLKFPVPSEATGSGLAPGSLRRIHFAGGEGHPGDLVMRVTESTEQSVRFEALSDTSHVAHWLHWRDSLVEWHPLPGGMTKVRWSITYDRALSPAWYFGPWEQFATTRAADYLIESLATP